MLGWWFFFWVDGRWRQEEKLKKGIAKWKFE